MAPSKSFYAVEVWTGDRHLILGVYRSEKSALRRMDHSIKHSRDCQERRVRIIREDEAMQHKSNMSVLSRSERQKRKQKWG